MLEYYGSNCIYNFPNSNGDYVYAMWVGEFHVEFMMNGLLSSRGNI